MMAMLRYKYRFLTFRMKEAEFSDKVRTGPDFDSEVSGALSEWGIQGYEVHEVHYDGEVLFIIMCLSWDPDELVAKPTKKKAKTPKKATSN